MVAGIPQALLKVTCRASHQGPVAVSLGAPGGPRPRGWAPGARSGDLGDRLSSCAACLSLSFRVPPNSITLARPFPFPCSFLQAGGGQGPGCGWWAGERDGEQRLGAGTARTVQWVPALSSPHPLTLEKRRLPHGQRKRKRGGPLLFLAGQHHPPRCKLGGSVVIWGAFQRRGCGFFVVVPGCTKNEPSGHVALAAPSGCPGLSRCPGPT